MILEKLLKSHFYLIPEDFNYALLLIELHERSCIDFVSVTMISMFFSSVMLQDSKRKILTEHDSLVVSELAERLEDSNLII